MNNTPDRGATDRRLGALEVPEARYKADLQLHDRAQKFSAELLKLALGGIAVIGFFIAHFPGSRIERSLNDTAFRVLIAVAVVAFSFSVAAALLQRFLAASAMFHHLKVIKLLMLGDDSLASDVEENMRMRTGRFLRAHALLKCAAWFLVVGAVAVSAAFVRMLSIG